MDHVQTNAASLLPASLRRRLASLLYEVLLLLGVWAFTFMVPYLVLGVMWHITPNGVLLWTHMFVVFGVYFLWYWRHGGQTLAMQTWRIKLVSAGSISEPTQAQLIRRYLLSWPSLIFFGAGLFWALFDRDRQFLHDRFSGTKIVYLGKAS